MGMSVKKFILEEIVNFIVENDYYEIYSLISSMEYYVFDSIKNGREIKFSVIPKNQYKKALVEFIKYGEFFRFPTKLIFDWKKLIIKNIILLKTLTEINGHSSEFPFDVFHDFFNNENDINGEYNLWLDSNGLNLKDNSYDWNNVYKFLDSVYDIESILPTFSNGQPVVTDYGLKPLLRLVEELHVKTKPEEIIVTLNKIMDVAHQRSDLAELFIEGGSNALSDISN